MKRSRVVVLATAVVGGWLAGAVIRGQQPPRPAAPPVPTFKSEEYLLLGNANRGAGEPMIAVDPTDPRNLVAVAMGSIQQLGGKPATLGDNAPYHRVAGSTINCCEQRRRHVGRERTGDPVGSRIPDAFADVTKDGGSSPAASHATDSAPTLACRPSGLDRQGQGRGRWSMIGDSPLRRFAPHLEPIRSVPGGRSRARHAFSVDRPFTHRRRHGCHLWRGARRLTRSTRARATAAAASPRVDRQWQELRHHLLVGSPEYCS
jgi:hypothetical protein